MKYVQLSHVKLAQKTNAGLAHLWQLHFATALHPQKNRFANMPVRLLQRMGSKS